MVSYETVIGLEVHVELRTQSKLFCSCANRYGADPNTLCCPICLGLPGALPVLNQRAVDLALRAALALNCAITSVIHFDRKHYFYPDLPKGYQITQYATPIGRNGFLEITTDTGPKRIGITRVHLEDDAGRLIHSNAEDGFSGVDYNRSGVPLIEIVTAPDLTSPREARLFLESLKSALQYLAVSDCKMQEGSLRCDANLSLRQHGHSEFGTKTELKNVNSFRNIERGLEYERQRQQAALELGGRVVPETRRWDDAQGVTVAMRGKEESDGYRYVPEPDLPALLIEQEWVDQVRSTLPELPDTRRERLQRDHGLSEYQALTITRSHALADLYEGVVGEGVAPKIAANWLLGEVSRLRNSHQLEWEQLPITAGDLSLLLDQISREVLSAAAAKDVLAASFASGRSMTDLIAERAVMQAPGEEELRQTVSVVVGTHPHVVAELRAGKGRALMYLVGQVMRASGGQADPVKVDQLLKEELGLPRY